jgi:predicted ABC-type ATPase
MERRPEFAVVAGPNGAGKSRLSPYYIHCNPFDGDLLALNLRREHPEWEERWIGGTVAGQLQKEKDDAIASRKDFSFETNFSNDLILNMIEEFKSNGYKVSLFYFGLASLDESLMRVSQRKEYGGHDVADDVVRYNFEEGVRRVQQNLHLFDTVTFIDGNSNFGEIVAIHVKGACIHEVANNANPWFEKFFALPFKKMLYD